MVRACRAEMNPPLDHPTGGCGLIRGVHSLGDMADTLSPSLTQRPSAPSRPGLRREIGFIGLLWASGGSIIGSGWLFGAPRAPGGAGAGGGVSRGPRGGGAL